MEVPGYTLVCANNRNNTKRGGDFIYYLNSLPLKVLDIQFLYESLNFEINIGGKVCNILCLCRLPSQTRETFETFADNLELNLDTLTNNNLFLNIAIGDFN